MKKTLAAFAGSLLLISATQAFSADANTAQPSIAVVNVQQLFQSSPKIADLNKQLQGKFKTRQDKLVASQKTLQDELDKLNKEGPTMNKKDKDALDKKVATEKQNLSKDAASFQQDLAKEQNKVMKGVLSQLNDVIASVAKKNSYSIVLDSQAVIYSADNADITKQVSKEFDSK